MPKVSNGGLAAVALLATACAPVAPEASETAAAESPAPIDASIRHRFAVQPITGEARNVILFIGDGMGVATVTAARIFDGQSRGEPGEENTLAFEKLPHLALVKTYNTNQQVPDSAGTATAMLAGIKTRAGVIGIGPEPRRRDCEAYAGHEVESIVDLAERNGKATGIVTTTRITHATPAAAYAHSPERDFESNRYLSAEERLKCTDIARQLLEFDTGDGIDVVLGGGYGEFVGARKGGLRIGDDEDLIADWLADDPARRFVSSADELEAVEPDGQLLGLFATSHLDYLLDPKRDEGQPTIAAMTMKALDILAERGDGYFLLVEGGRIDHGHHIGRAGFALAEAQAFNEAIARTLARIDPSETLVLVTADHSHVMTIAGYPTRGNPILGHVVQNDEHGEPETTARIAADERPYSTLAYANGPGAVDGKRAEPSTGPMAIQQALVPLIDVDRDGNLWPTESHGGEDVALYAAGPWAHLVGGVLEQNAVFHIMRYAYGWGRPGETIDSF